MFCQNVSNKVKYENDNHYMINILNIFLTIVDMWYFSAYNDKLNRLIKIP